ncbi:TPA: Fe-S cluster assembly ATPase SufC [Candidatus Woesearchaeota archaeon]|nr:Fe-S cluster assembly ATPase SufC [Candidatus Woesearchaeota archaeon]
MAFLEIRELEVSVEGKKILNGISLDIDTNQVTALMGPNGSGKSTLAYALMGHPKYKIDSGKILINGEDITELGPDERAKRGLFLSFQHPQEVPGVSVSNFIRTALNSVKGKPVPVPEFLKLLRENMAMLKMDPAFASRFLNEGFSGGEKKRAEILQLAILEPKIAVLDETDSGTDVDALRVISEGINKVHEKTKMGILVITHYKRILNYLKPDRVIIIAKGKVVMEGSHELADTIETKGYKAFGIEDYEEAQVIK